MDQIGKVLAVITAPVSFGYRFLFKAFRFITGKDTVAFAWMLFLISNSMNLASDAIHHVGNIIVILDSLFVIWSWFLTHSYQQYARNLTKLEILIAWRWSFLCSFYFLYGSVFLFLWLALRMFEASIEQYIFCVWALSLCIYKPGGKSIFAKAKEKIKAMIPEPRPAFAPVGV